MAVNEAADIEQHLQQCARCSAAALNPIDATAGRNERKAASSKLRPLT